MMAANPFIWGDKGQKLTPQQVEERRKRAMQRDAKQIPGLGHWAASLNQGLTGYLSGRDERMADRGETEGLAGADDYIANNPVLASLIGGGGSGVSMGVPAGAQSAPMDAMGAAPMAGAGHDHNTHAGSSHSDWLKYSNQGATRNQPLDDKLVSALSFLPDMGITMDVISGGQAAKGSGGARTGSTRHDHGNAADADFYMGGRKLDWNNPDDQPIFSEIVSRARANGVTGIGAGDDYMGAGRMHIGFGPDAVWGAGGSGANAPDWLRQAANGTAGAAPQQASYQPSGGNAPQQDNSVMAALAGGLSDPWVAQKYGPVLQALMGQQISRSNADYAQQLAQQDPYRMAQLEKLNLENEALRNPVAAGPEWAFDNATGQYYDKNNPQGGAQPIPGFTPKETGPLVSIDQSTGQVGTIPQGYELFVDPDTGARSMRPIAGGPEDKSVQADVAQSNRNTSTSIISNAAKRAREAARNRQVGGFLGGIAAKNPSSQNAEVYRQVEVLQSNAKIENLTAMRAASATGGALGAVSDKESAMLAAKSGALDPASPTFERDLDDYERTLLQVVHGFDEGNRLFEQSREGGDFSGMGLAEIGQVDIGLLTPDQMDAFEARMKELGL